MRYIKYIGPSHVRQITAADWRSVGINAETVQWSQWNGFSISADSLTDEQIRRAIEPDRFFVITDDQDQAPQTIENSRMTGEMATQPEVDLMEVMNGASPDQAATEQVSDATPASTTGGKADAKTSAK